MIKKFFIQKVIHSLWKCEFQKSCPEKHNFQDLDNFRFFEFLKVMKAVDNFL